MREQARPVALNHEGVSTPCLTALQEFLRSVNVFRDQKMYDFWQEHYRPDLPKSDEIEDHLAVEFDEAVSLMLRSWPDGEELS